ncbi:MAG: transcription elongation factor GreA [Dehalococcoidia bacterium]|nr:transcription elongation factor GreA [Dehalococcoidia bacterium]
MAEESERGPASQITLRQALTEYLQSLKADQRVAYESYVRKYVEYVGESQVLGSLTGARVESYAEAQIRQSDPNAPERVAALKAWFQFLKKRDYTRANYGVHIRVRRPTHRSTGSAVRVQEVPLEMTADGVEALRRELEELDAERPGIVLAIQEAREDKDFRENAPLDAAREALAFNEQRRKQIESALKRAVVVDRATDDRSAVGSRVTVTRLDNGRQYHYKLVGAREANAGEQRISVESPVGRQLLGRLPGETVTITVPSGVIEYRVDDIAQE